MIWVCSGLPSNSTATARRGLSRSASNRDGSRPVETLTRSLVRHAHAVAREVGARVVLLHADVVEEDSDLVDLIEDVGFRVILVSRKVTFHAPEGWGDLCEVVRVPDIPMTRA